MGTVAVIDYGMGNLRSVAKALEHVADGQRVVVTDDPSTVLAAERVVFPGVGAIRDCMDALDRLGLADVVLRCTERVPFLGICLGMQALFDLSEENNGTPGLGILPGAVRQFPRELKDPASGEALKIPHMGWNQVRQGRSHPLWLGIAQNSRFYFVHSYYAAPARAELACGITTYGMDFACACARDNIFAVQFHPEKSQHAGLILLGNFLRWEGAS